MKLKFTANKAILLFCIYCMLVFNIGFWSEIWKDTYMDGVRDWFIVLTMPVFVLAAMNFFMQFFVWPKVHRVLIPILLVLSAMVSYAIMTQGIYFNSDMMLNVIETNPAEASAWLSVKCILWVALFGVLPAILYARYGKLEGNGKWYKALGWRLLSMLVSLLIVGGVAAVGYQHYASFFRNNKGINHKIVPTNFMGASFKTAYNIYDAHKPFEQIGLDAKREVLKKARKHVFILVVGETTRAQNWGLNPNTPNTTPELKNTAGVINFTAPNVTSCGTETAVSVPCMFSKMSRSSYNGNQAKHEEGLMDILKRVGLYTSWRENDGGCKGACDRIKNIDVRNIAEPGQCDKDGCYDMALLNGLKKEIDEMPHDGIIVLHTMGSHGPAYYLRYPAEFRKFAPTCDTNQIQDCSKEQLQNTYNNTILYVDHMLTQTINLLKKEDNIDAALWYFSDHGESLGENGIYLHAAPYAIAPEYQTHIPMIFWANDNWYKAMNVSSICLKQQAETQAHSHDNLFHSMLGIFDVRTKEYNKSLDMFAPCRS